MSRKDMVLNRKQLLTVWIGIGASVLTLLYPVCDGTAKNLADSDFSTVHQYLYSWPLVPLDYGRTLFQLGIVVLVTAGVFVSLHCFPLAQPALAPADASTEADVIGPITDAVSQRTGF